MNVHGNKVFSMRHKERKEAIERHRDMGQRYNECTFIKIAL